jgi:hypothetical protein
MLKLFLHVENFMEKYWHGNVKKIDVLKISRFNWLYYRLKHNSMLSDHVTFCPQNRLLEQSYCFCHCRMYKFA